MFMLNIVMLILVSDEKRVSHRIRQQDIALPRRSFDPPPRRPNIGICMTAGRLLQEVSPTGARIESLAPLPSPRVSGQTQAVA
jgi:hypothetical protein